MLIMKTKLFFASVLLTFIFSCEKENELITCSSPIDKTYFPLTVGSYWIYQWYRVDTLGNETLLENSIDTVRIVKDTLIGNYQYAVQEEQYSLTSSIKFNRHFLRDSVGYLVNLKGEILFSVTNFIDTLSVINDVTYKINYFMASDTFTINNSAGIFECLNYQGQVIPLIGNFDWTERYLNNFYAKEVGKIQETTFYFSSPNILERRLIEYRIE